MYYAASSIPQYVQQIAAPAWQEGLESLKVEFGSDLIRAIRMVGLQSVIVLKEEALLGGGNSGVIRQLLQEETVNLFVTCRYDMLFLCPPLVITVEEIDDAMVRLWRDTLAI